MRAALAVAPLLGLIVSAAVLALLTIGGWNFSATELMSQWQRLDPIAGMQRLFSLQGFIELLKSLARLSVVALVAVLVLRRQYSQFSGLSTETLRAAITPSLKLAATALTSRGSGLAAIAAVNVPLALWQHNSSSRMSGDEIREQPRDN